MDNISKYFTKGEDLYVKHNNRTIDVKASIEHVFLQQAKNGLLEKEKLNDVLTKLELKLSPMELHFTNSFFNGSHITLQELTDWWTNPEP